MKLFVTFALLLAGAAFAADVDNNLDGAASVLRNMIASGQIPAAVLVESECIAVIPAAAKGGVIVGGEFGHGVVSCQTKSGWSSPAFLTLSGGSVGLQAGLEHQDIVLLMNKEGEQELSQGHWNLGARAVTIGADTSATGGVESKGWKTPVIVYTSSSGAYAGATFEGSKIGIDDQTMKSIYGANANLHSILNGEVQAPPPAQSFMAALKQVTANKT